MPSSGVIAAQMAQCEALQRLYSTHGYSPLFRLVRRPMEAEVWISPVGEGRGDPAGQFHDDLVAGFGPVAPLNGAGLSPQQLVDLAARIAAGVSSQCKLSEADWTAWQAYASNPFFAAALMGDCSAQQLSEYTAWLSRQYGVGGGPVPPEWGSRLAAMQTSFCTWVNGLDDPSVAKQAILDLLQTGGASTDDVVDGSVGMSLLLAGCSFSDGLTLEITEAMYQWSQSHPVPYPGASDPAYPGVSEPNPYVYPDGSKVYNVLVGVMLLLGNNQAAAAQFFKADSSNPPARVSWAVVTDWDDGGQSAAYALTAGDALNPNLPWVKQMLPPGLAVVPPDPKVVVKLGHAFAASGSSLTPDKLLEISLLATAMVNNCPEPFQHLFLEHLDELRVADIREGGQAMTWPVTGTINVDVDKLLGNQPSPLWIFFHEYGHLIDQNSSTPGFDSPNYTYPDSTGTPRTLAWWLQQDVRTNLENAFNEPNAPVTKDAAQRQRIVDAILSHDVLLMDRWVIEAGIHPVPGSDAAVFQQLKTYYVGPDKIGNPQSRTVSDNYGAQTWNVISGGYTHDIQYWWAPWPWAPPEAEFWSNYFADQVTDMTQQIDNANPSCIPPGRYIPPPPSTSANGVQVPVPTSLKVTQDYFPTASQAVQAFAGSLP